MLFDSHCHPQFPQYDADREEVIKRTLAAECGMICVGTDLEMSKKAIELANKYDGVWATVGLHPSDIDIHSKFSILDLQIAGNPKVVAIGEVGLDYYRTPEPAKQKRQGEIFVEFIKFALNTRKPLVIHCRDAYDDMIKILSNWTKNYNKSSPYDSPLYLRGVIHSFNGSWSEAEKFIDLGFYIGLNGIITFSEEYSEMVSQIPLEKILLETDAPYLAPVPYRGKRNEPLYVLEVAKKIAELKNISVKEITEQTVKNTNRLFGLNE
jgi:TatD DNase family protein